VSDRLVEWMGAACGILYVVLIMVGSSIGGPTSTVAKRTPLTGLSMRAVAVTS
jgi:hypothetical protein